MTAAERTQRPSTQSVHSTGASVVVIPCHIPFWVERHFLTRGHLSALTMLLPPLCNSDFMFHVSHTRDCNRQLTTYLSHKYNTQLMAIDASTYCTLLKEICNLRVEFRVLRFVSFFFSLICELLDSHALAILKLKLTRFVCMIVGVEYKYFWRGDYIIIFLFLSAQQ